MTTIDRCREFYSGKIAPMIHARFSEYENRIAAGIAGEGSECWGFDDEYSQDHDFAVSVCLWLTDEDYDAIGERLNKEYLTLAGGDASGTRLEYRRGVQRISDFYCNLLGFDFDTVTPALSDGHWFYADDFRLAAAVNGEVFRDDLGCFTSVRGLLESYYPEKVFRMKLANSLHGYAAAIQANYPRCMARGDTVSAHACISRGMEEAMRIAFLLNRRYMPYYKWSYRALKDMTKTASGSMQGELNKLADLIGRLSVTGSQENAWRAFRYNAVRINMDDEVVRLSEETAAVLAGMLYEQGLTDSRETFLEVHCGQVSGGIQK